MRRNENGEASMQANMPKWLRNEKPNPCLAAPGAPRRSSSVRLFALGDPKRVLFVRRKAWGKAWGIIFFTTSPNARAPP